jgi:NADPH:quinone reductase-like Zn-dependent oxidoreductase
MIQTATRTAKTVELKNYCHLAKAHSYIEVTEWTNGEGVDVVIDSTHFQTISLTLGEFTALQLLMAYSDRSLGC